MLSKLLKYEFRATGRIMLPVYALLLVTAGGTSVTGSLMGRYPESTVLSIFRTLFMTLFAFTTFGVLLLTLVLHVFGNSIINLMRQVDNPVVIFFTDLIDLRFFLLLFLQSLVFTLMFMVLPNKRRSRFMESLPGGVLSSLGWLVFSDIYSIYVENFSKYSTIYGSVYGIAITMLWLYCCMSILFYGGALNRYLMDK